MKGKTVDTKSEEQTEMYCIQYSLTRIISYMLNDVQCDTAAIHT
jgi:hypothetical protein